MASAVVASSRTAVTATVITTAAQAMSSSTATTVAATKRRRTVQNGMWEYRAGRGRLRGCCARSLRFAQHQPHGYDTQQAERSEEHTSELQSRLHLVCRLLLEKKKKIVIYSAPRGGARQIRRPRGH